MAAVRFVTEQPTGMTVVGDVLFVAGGLELMAFDMAAKVGSDEAPPVLGTCGAAATCWKWWHFAAPPAHSHQSRKAG